MHCPKCQKRTKSLQMFDLVRWIMVTICRGCGGIFRDKSNFSDKNNKDIIWEYLGQYATKKGAP